uniref:Predicted protein n=1 Tax=Hordeum vulgare subsp. vulgare TaxID=112509 RepID=F2EL30_HORVV|nr:predicted protein [Hordeum vulgare subsp. vulgare]
MLVRRPSILASSSHRISTHRRRVVPFSSRPNNTRFISPWRRSILLGLREESSRLSSTSLARPVCPPPAWTSDPGPRPSPPPPPFCIAGRIWGAPAFPTGRPSTSYELHIMKCGRLWRAVQLAPACSSPWPRHPSSGQLPCR